MISYLFTYVQLLYFFMIFMEIFSLVAEEKCFWILLAYNASHSNVKNISYRSVNDRPIHQYSTKSGVGDVFHGLFDQYIRLTDLKQLVAKYVKYGFC